MNTNPPLTVIHIRRRFAVWLEDCIETVLPDDVDPDNKEAVDEWADENYEAILANAINHRDYGEDAAGFGIDVDSTRFLWEDQHHADIDAFDDEFVTEVPERGYKPI